MSSLNALRLLASLWSSAALLGMVACTGAPARVEPVPVALDPGPTARVLSTLAATGVQVYECRAAADTAAPGWAFVAPDAVLLDAQGRSVGTHGAGPVWSGPDGSRVLGSVRSRVDAPVAASIPWLLLSTRSTGGAGAFSGVTHIQRLHTEGGIAPAGGCDTRTLGQRVRVPYRADYRLFVAA